VHTEFSMLDGASRLDELVAKAVADGQPALGITDHGNMYGTLATTTAASARPAAVASTTPAATPRVGRSSTTT
jgi:DNA polymerase III alpha subunit